MRPKIICFAGKTKSFCLFRQARRVMHQHAFVGDEVVMGVGDFEIIDNGRTVFKRNLFLSSLQTFKNHIKNIFFCFF